MKNLKKITMLVSVIILLVCPALAQQVATSKAVGEIKTSDRLAPPQAVVTDKESSPNETLAESRLQHRSLMQKRILMLRNYLTTTPLSARQRLIVEDLVREMEASLNDTERTAPKEASVTQGRNYYPVSPFNESAVRSRTNSAFKSAEPLQEGKKEGQDDQGQENTQGGGGKKEETRFFDVRRFSLSGGIVFTKLERREFQPVLGIARDANGNPTNGTALTYVIGLKENNDWTVGPLLLLNTRVWESADRNFGIAGSVGITGKRENAGTDIDYFFGPSISIIKGLVYVSGGLYVGKQQRLAGDAFLSAPIDKGDTVPVVKEYHSKPGFSVTFRILPLPTKD